MLVRGWLCARLRSILGMGVVAPFLMVTGVHLTQAEQRPQPIANEKRVEAQDAATPSPDIYSLQINYDLNNQVGPFNTGRISSLTLIPTFPIHLTSNLNVISRTSIPFLHVSGLYRGFGYGEGLSNVQQSFFFSPRGSSNGLIWGVGPTFFLPTAVSKKVGSYQTGIGPALAFIKSSGPWVLGLRVSQVWSIAGPIPVGKKGLNFFYAEPMVSFTTAGGWTFSLNAESVYDWNVQKLVLPFNFTIERLVTIQNLPISVALGARYFAASVPDGPKGWGARLSFTIVSLN